MVWTVIIIVGLVVDQLSKQLASMHLAGGHEQVLIPGFLQLIYSENPGAAWSFLAGHDWGIYVLSAVSLLAALVFIYLLVRSETRWRSLSLALIISGTVGNLVDRVRLGYVVDFIDVHLGSYRYPTFNVADSLLVVGMILLFIDLLIIEPRQARRQVGEAERSLGLDGDGD